MELLFLWIEDFRFIKQQGINFSARLKFSLAQPKKEEAGS
jgi:hypothetical protein